MNNNLVQLAKDLKDGKVFISWMIPRDNHQLASEMLFKVFPTLSFLKLSKPEVRSSFEENNKVLYQYIEESVRIEDGVPVFHSFNGLNEEETKELQDILREDLEERSDGNTNG